jgi:hypothetical protein
MTNSSSPSSDSSSSSADHDIDVDGNGSEIVSHIADDRTGKKFLRSGKKILRSGLRKKILRTVVPDSPLVRKQRNKFEKQLRNLTAVGTKISRKGKEMRAGEFGKSVPVRHTRAGQEQVRHDMRANADRADAVREQLNLLNAAQQNVDNAAQVAVAAPQAAVVTASKFVWGYSDDTPMLDIDFDKFGTLLGLTNSIQFIPDKYVTKTRKVFIGVMRLLVVSIHDIMLWKKFFVAACDALWKLWK